VHERDRPARDARCEQGYGCGASKTSCSPARGVICVPTSGGWSEVCSTCSAGRVATRASGSAAGLRPARSLVRAGGAPRARRARRRSPRARSPRRGAPRLPARQLADGERRFKPRPRRDVRLQATARGTTGRPCTGDRRVTQRFLRSRRRNRGAALQPAGISIAALAGVADGRWPR